jgi:hypothetical protein
VAAGPGGPDCCPNDLFLLLALLHVILLSRTNTQFLTGF